jgi:hypothetical protein
MERKIKKRLASDPLAVWWKKLPDDVTVEQR